MKKGRLNHILLFSGIFLSLIPLSLIRRAPDETNQTTAESGLILQSEPIVAVQLDVPLLNQLDPPALLLGCEVTSLAMILQYNGITVTKNELADKLPVVPIYYEDGLHGNPNEGFVGDVTGSDYGFCVYHGPIAALASDYIPTARIKDISGQDFDFVIAALDRGNPVWVVTTTTFLSDDELEVWQTPTGPVTISYIMHSVAVVGYDTDSLYINNPYGQKDQKVDRHNFILAWEQMGKQAVYIESMAPDQMEMQSTE
ncbi:C39 family peptidase [uncultured Trichococcus sp.]|uniref:C39 family peptidase n=1 Tax=uncultured Trichococcus sp. TaxID=189665 RepID=UPI002A189CFF|nr:C39 family peptidase [uncultured Trichococcus sp.]